MLRYYQLEPGGGRLHEITEGEYEFRLRSHTLMGTEPEVMKEFMQPSHGFESRFGSCFVLEDHNG